LETEQVRIAVVADAHFSAGEDGRRYFAQFTRIQEAIARSGTAFTLAAGDLTEHGQPDEFTRFRNAAKRFPSPVLCVPGNHDVGNKGGPAESLARQIGVYESMIGPTFFCEMVGETRVIGLNASLFGSGLRQESEQWSLLEAGLTQTPPSLILLHYPPFLDDADEPDDPYWNINSGPRSRLLSMINESTVRAVISGHLHRPLMREWRGVPFVTVPPVSFGLPPGQQPEGWALVTVPPSGPVHAEIHSLAPTDATGEELVSP